MIQNFTLVFVLILIGYYTLSRSNQYKERLLTASNYALLYESAIAGFFIFASFWVIAFVIKVLFLGCTYDVQSARAQCYIDTFYPLPFFDVLFVSGVFAWLSKYVDNRLLSDDELGIRIARKSGLIANVVLDALAADHLVQVTTVRRKVYIGYVLLGPGISREGNVADIAIVPLYSGHRVEKTQRLVEDIDYSRALFNYANLVYEEGEEVDVLSPQRPEMSVVIPIGEIALIRRHTEGLSESFLPID